MVTQPSIAQESNSISSIWICILNLDYYQVQDTVQAGFIKMLK